MSVDIIVINVTAERRSILYKQFDELNLPFSVKFMDAATPTNSKGYLPANCEGQRAKTICCARSHCLAIELAGNPLAADFTIIMEDDVALHRTAFVPIVNELVERWDTIMPEKESSMVSLGWIPCNNYEKYLPAKSSITFSSKSDVKFLRDRFALGLQAYMVRRDAAKKLTPIIIHDTFDAFYKYFRANPVPFLDLENELEAIDVIIPRLLLQTVLFPPIAIEMPLKSILEHNNQTLYWAPYFKGYEHLRDEYWS